LFCSIEEVFVTSSVKMGEFVFDAIAGGPLKTQMLCPLAHRVYAKTVNSKMYLMLHFIFKKRMIRKLIECKYTNLYFVSNIIWEKRFIFAAKKT